MTPEELARAYEPARAVYAPRQCRIAEAGYAGPCWVRDGHASYTNSSSYGRCVGCNGREVVAGNEARHSEVMYRIRRELRG